MTFNRDEFKELLDYFAEEVRKGNYKKTNYDTWRSIVKVTNDCNRITCNFCLALNTIKIETNGSFYTFVCDDKSLGEFLYRYLLHNQKLTLKVNDCNVANKNNTIVTTDGLTMTVNKDDGTVYLTPDERTVTECFSTVEDLNTTREQIEQLGKMVQNHINKDKIFDERKENNKMKLANFEFGSCEHDNVRLSMYGMAVKNAAGTWVAYDKATGSIMDVEILNFDGGKYMFKMPVAINDVSKGDVVIHCRKPMFVTGVADGKISAVDPYEGEEKVILLTRSPFGFDFVTKVVCLFDNMIGGADASNPFGNMLPFLMLSDSNDIDPMMLMLMGGQMDMSNPLMMYALLAKDSNHSDLLPLMLMMNGGSGYTCQCHCTDTEGK